MTREQTPLDALGEQWLDTLLELQPELHVHLGRPGREGEYADLSPDGHQQLLDAGAAVLRQARERRRRGAAGGRRVRDRRTRPRARDVRG
ncbi:MAG: hypothetical protein EON52_05085, partial [Actinomycetales bacterium]